MLKKYRNIEYILIVVSLVLFAGVMTTMITIYFNQSLNTKTLSQIHQLKEIAKDIVYHDEVLTMSARVNILDQKPHWQERYHRHALLLDQTLNQAASNDVSIQPLLVKIQAANQSLISMEALAFELVAENENAKAADLLFGDDYADTKLAYTQYIEQIISEIHTFEQNLTDEYQGRERLLLTLFGFVFITFIALLSLTYIVKKIKDRQIDALILHDPLTALLNRRSFDVALPHEFSRCKREQRIMAIAILDVDNFKLFNDIYGHIAGDNTLMQVGETLGKLTRRSTEFAYRIGGEEFALILSISDAREAEEIAMSILHAIRALNIPHKGNPPHDMVTMSIGLAIISSDFNITPEAAFTEADSALYDAKNDGRNALKSVSF